MPPDDDTTARADDDARDDAELGAGFGNDAGAPPAKPAANGKPPETPDPATAPAARETVPKPEYVRLTKTELAELRAAAAKVASHDAQYAKAWGSIGNLHKMLNEIRDGSGSKVELSTKAFNRMRDQFPELADMTLEAVQSAIAGIPRNAGVDDTKVAELLAEHSSKREIANLEDAYPDWRDIVGAVDITKQLPDAANPFRKWLGTKDATYQARINASDSAVVIERAIDRFRRETKTPAPAAPNPRDAARRAQMAAAVQPRGDGAAATADASENDEFAAGYNSR